MYDLDLLRALDDALTRAEKDETIRVVVIRGRGDSFCAGASLDARGRAAVVRALRGRGAHL